MSEWVTASVGVCNSLLNKRANVATNMYDAPSEVTTLELPNNLFKIPEQIFASR